MQVLQHNVEAWEGQRRWEKNCNVIYQVIVIFVYDAHLASLNEWSVRGMNCMWWLRRF